MRYLKLRRLLLFLVVLFFGACSTEIQLARKIQKEKDKISILCEFPDYIIRTNSFVPLPEGLDEEEQQTFLDSTFEYSRYVQYIDDEIFLQNVIKHIKKEFKNHEINYYNKEQINEFLSSEGSLYLINFKQLEIEERWEAFHDEMSTGSASTPESNSKVIIYEEDFWINGVSVNAWIDLAKVNDTVEIQRQLYTESLLKDDVDGAFIENYSTGEMNYRSRIYPIQVEDLWELELQSAEEFSSFIFNVIINKEIRDRLNYIEGIEPVNEWEVSPKSGRILPEELY